MILNKWKRLCWLVAFILLYRIQRIKVIQRKAFYRFVFLYGHKMIAWKIHFLNFWGFLLLLSIRTGHQVDDKRKNSCNY